MELSQTRIAVKSDPRSERASAFNSRAGRLTRVIRELEVLSSQANTQPGQQHIEQAIAHLVDAKLVEGMVHLFGAPIPDEQLSN